MIFREELIKKIIAGEKTVTRRPVKSKLEVVSVRPPEVNHVERDCRYKPGGGPGGTYALQGPPEKGSRARARTIPGYRLRVLSVERMPLGIGFDGGFPEARREGFPDWNEFRAYWLGLYGSYEPDQLVDRIEFELVGAAA